MLVYRIENDEGDGMYCCADIDLSFTEVMANYPDPDRRIMQSEFYEVYGIEYVDVHILPETSILARPEEAVLQRVIRLCLCMCAD